jgi:hypothetical protein
LLAGLWVLGSILAITVGSLGVVEWDSLIHAPSSVTSAPPAPTTAAHPARVAPSGDTAAVEDDASSTPQPRKTLAPTRRQVRLLRSGGERLLTLAVSIGFSVLALAGFFWFSVSYPSRVRRRVLPGAVLAVFLGLVISWGFGIYIRSLTNYAVFYGSLAAVAVLLVWLWLASLAILVGAELNAQLEGRRD